MIWLTFNPIFYYFIILKGFHIGPIPCQKTYSIKHVLIDCTDLDLIRSGFYPVPDMKTLFDTISVDRILTFIKEVKLFSKI